jgi:hypothetical protein
MQSQEITQKQEFLRSLREKLLDLSLKNNLLNFHDKSGKIVKSVDELPSHIFKYLVEDRKEMTLLPLELNESISNTPDQAQAGQMSLFTNDLSQVTAQDNLPFNNQN